MSLTFTASTNIVNFGSAASIDGLGTAGTYIGWVYPTALAGDRAYFYKLNGSYAGIGLKPPGANGQGLRFDLARATAALRIQDNDSVVSLNAWNFVACTWDTAGSNADQKLFVGGLTSRVAEVASYNFQTVGSGTVTSVAGEDLAVGNINGGLAATWAAWVGDIAFVAFWDTQLTLAQIAAQQFSPHVTANCVLFCWLGFNGTGTQPDWSGSGNNGAVTGTSASGNNVPISPLVVNNKGFRGLPGVSGHPASGPGVPLGMQQSVARPYAAGAALSLLSVAGTLTSASTLSRQTSAARAGALAPAGALIRQTQQSHAGAAAPSGALLKQTAVSPSGALTPAGNLLKQTAVSALGALAPAGALIKQVSNSLSGAVTPAGVVAGVRAILLAVGGTLAPAGSLQRAVARSLAGALAPAGSLVKRVAHGMGGSVAASGAVSAVIAGVAKVRATFRGMWRGMRRGS